MLHGPLMACGFLGTLIGVERAVGTGKRWAYLGPALVALGVLLALLGAPVKLGPLLVTLGSAIVTLVLIGLARLHPANFTVTMAAGGAAWVGGNLLWWLGWPLYVAALWWIGFLVLTIAGERLELSRMLKLTRSTQSLFTAAALLLGAGILFGGDRLHGGHGRDRRGVGGAGCYGWASTTSPGGGSRRAVRRALAPRRCFRAMSGWASAARSSSGAGARWPALLRRRAPQHLSWLRLRHDPGPRSHRLSGGVGHPHAFSQSSICRWCCSIFRCCCALPAT
jgi:hypothetical protein